MRSLSRRKFLAAGATCAAVGAAAREATPPSDVIRFVGDGLWLPPAEYADLLAKLAHAGKAKPDVYLSGGAVEELEARFAKELGKERAVFVPTGTLANHLAIRRLAGDRTRVLVQAESHVYCDAYDCVQALSRLNLVPLAAGRATFTVAEVEEACARAAGGPHPVPVGAISIECPVRRRRGEAFDFAEMTRVSAFARARGIGLHLDGARLYLAAAYTGVGVAKYAALFDTVYVSLYKYFNAAAGAVLAGPRDVIEKVARDRMVFGGGLFQAWPYAAEALHYLDGFAERFRRAREAADAVLGELAKHPRFRVERVPNGTNIVRLHVAGVDAAGYAAALRKAGVIVQGARPGAAEYLLTVNETLLRRPAGDVAKAFLEALPR